MDISYVKALHIIFVVCWFAALFYIVRLFIYTKEAQGRDEVARPILTGQLTLMQKKLWYIIGWPSMVGTYVFGTWMLSFNFDYYLSQPWMWLKLIAVGLLTIYHFGCQTILSKQKQGVFNISSIKLRLFNELATLFLVAIVFLVVVKSTSGLIVGTLGLLALGAMLTLAVYLYRRSSRKTEK
ncbi:MAG TPA: CopD family protein [Bacteroidia bacterium]|nr:CopD family protein [Bacteroidia bacterium]